MTLIFHISRIVTASGDEGTVYSVQTIEYISMVMTCELHLENFVLFAGRYKREYYVEMQMLTV